MLNNIGPSFKLFGSRIFLTAVAVLTRPSPKIKASVVSVEYADHLLFLLEFILWRSRTGSPTYELEESKSPTRKASGLNPWLVIKFLWTPKPGNHSGMFRSGINGFCSLVPMRDLRSVRSVGSTILTDGNETRFLLVMGIGAGHVYRWRLWALVYICFAVLIPKCNY